jgi:hypothetical protein
MEVTLRPSSASLSTVRHASEQTWLELGYIEMSFRADREVTAVSTTSAF